MSHRNRLKFGLLLPAILMGASLGCGSKGVPPTDIAEQTQTFDEAVAKFAAGDFAGAKTAATQAIEGGALSADQVADATLILIEAAIESGDYATAEKSIADAEINALDMARVYVLKGKLARKQGNESAAQEAFQRAKLEDPNVVIPN
jgi:tetratricopeptide (TPR) repeat protein